ncbi:hypothetical protein GOP47_0022880 [Adiantum capillus-veneris]|uniref:Short-chain dehydrogenase TIC 32, chloroplastic n=1 Tax=Adiantum capillus-veneris TaxID=13818 RepID=A0A9D4U8J7_ADICA|nr:hypothetical protein GOP47_0022880 [Adiantum capillus-veneris]
MGSWLDYLRGSADTHTRPARFGYRSTAEEVTQGLRLSHLTVIVTGASSGIGAEAARVLAKGGARLILPARSLKKAELLRENMLQQLPKACIIALELDLASFASVRSFAAQFLSLDLPLNILINNAGVYCKSFKRSEEGFEMSFATNHLGHFLLTNLVMERMVESAKESGVEGRIVNVSSCLHSWVVAPGIHFTSLHDPHSFVESMSYAQSKLANILHAKELARRLKEAGVNVTANALHPGIVKTNITRDRRGLLTDAILAVASKFFMKTIPQGAAVICYVATHPDLVGVSGKYYADCAEAACSPCASDDKQAHLLWSYSERATGSVEHDFSKGSVYGP